MAADNVTPIGPHVPMPEEPSVQVERLKSALAAMASRVDMQRDQILKAMAVISCVAAAAPTAVDKDEPLIGLALNAVYSMLDSACGELDPVHFELEEVSRG